VFDHVTIRVSDREVSERFYDTVLAALGLDKTRESEHFAAWRDFSLAHASLDKPVTRGLLRSVSARPRRQQRRGGSPRAGTARTDRPCLDSRRRPRCLATLLGDRGSAHRLLFGSARRFAGDLGLEATELDLELARYQVKPSYPPSSFMSIS
jgi:catechol 2,3-dioxygenase-like lactoylglutathione lyase family enzyme